MAFFRLEEKHIRPVVFAATGLFLCLAILYFSPADIPHKISFALATLFVASLWLVPWPMSMALLFSALGDYAGSCGIFLAQMGFFAVAHIFMIGFFVCRWIRKVEPDKKLTAKAKGQAFIFLLMTLALLGFVFTGTYSRRGGELWQVYLLFAPVEPQCYNLYSCAIEERIGTQYECFADRG